MAGRVSRPAMATLGHTASTITLSLSTMQQRIAALREALTQDPFNNPASLTEERHTSMTATMTVNRIEFPLEPRNVGNFSNLGSPSVPNRWQRVKYKANRPHVDILFMGLCGYCGYALWQNFDEDFSVDDFIGKQYQYAKPLHPEGDETEIATQICVYCDARSRHASALSMARDYGDERDGRFHQWPDVVLNEIKAGVAARALENLRFVDPRPTPPAEGAYVLIKGEKFARFESFNSKGKVVADGRQYDPEMVEVLVPLVHGTKHPRVIGLPGSGMTGDYRILRYSGYNGVVQSVTPHAGSQTVRLNTIAVPVPLLNPVEESAEDKADRLQYQFDRLKAGMHHRMVAEGEARDWCGEFDPILDSVGLDPRTGKTIVTLTMVATVDNATFTDKDLLDTGWTSYISTSLLRVQSAKVSQPTSRPMLSA